MNRKELLSKMCQNTKIDGEGLPLTKKRLQKTKHMNFETIPQIYNIVINHEHVTGEMGIF